MWRIHPGWRTGEDCAVASLPPRRSTTAPTASTTTAAATPTAPVAVRLGLRLRIGSSWWCDRSRMNGLGLGGGDCRGCAAVAERRREREWQLALAHDPRGRQLRRPDELRLVERRQITVGDRRGLAACAEKRDAAARDLDRAPCADRGVALGVHEERGATDAR